MSNRTLTNEEVEQTFRPLWLKVNVLIDEASAGDTVLRFALNRKLFKELSYVERDKPGARRILKIKKFAQQAGKCPECNEPLPEFGKGAHLDRRNAIDGYTLENTELIHGDCHIKRQERKRYS